MATGFDWFRSWHGAPTDPKWLVIERRALCEGVTPGMVSAVAWALMDYASQNTERGSVEGFDVETYAAWSGWSEDQIEAIIEAMRGKGIITDDSRLAAWDKRQPKREDPTNNERQRRFRDNKRNSEDVTQSNAGVTQGNELSRLDKSERREEKIRVSEDAQAGEDTQSLILADAERLFVSNLLAAVQERDPGQRFYSGFSLPEQSRLLLIQAIQKDALITAKSIAWALDQWEEAKPQERFNPTQTGCVNWMLTSIINSYRNNQARRVNGHSQDPDNRPRVKAPPADALAAADARQAAYERQVAEELARAGRLA